MFQRSGRKGPAQAPQLGWESSLLGRETCIGVLLPTPPSWLGNVKTKPAKNICVGGGKLTLPPLSSFLETVATVKYSKTEAEREQGEAPVGRQREPCPPRPLLPVAIWLCDGVGGSGGGWWGAGLHGLKITASCDARVGWTLRHHPAQPQPLCLAASGLRDTEGTRPRSHGQLGLFRILLALHEIRRFCDPLVWKPGSS